MNEFDIFYTSNSLQYLNDIYKFLDFLTKKKPKLIFLCGLLAGNIPNFKTNQKYYNNYIEVNFTNFGQLNNYIEKRNYKLVKKEYSNQKYFGKYNNLPMNNFYYKYRIEKKLNLMYINKTL